MAKTGPMINIGGDEKDASYRYKMPPLITKVEGRGNGIKTILVNVTDVCKHLHTEPQYATRFFGIECGAVSKWDDKRDAGIVHGQHERSELQQTLKKFIREFILCPKCNLPELQMKVQTKKSILIIRCASCGHKGKNLSTHKVKQYIINHPPKSKPKISSQRTPKPDKDDENNKSTTDKKEDTNTEALTATTDINVLGGANDEKWSVDVSDKAVAERKFEEMKTFAHGTIINKEEKENENENENENNENNNENNENNNKNEIENENENENDPYRTLKSDLNNSDSGPAQILREFLNENNNNNNLDIEQILDEIKRLGMAHNLDDAKKFKVTFDATCKFNTASQLITSLKKNSKLFARLNKNDKDSNIFFACLEEIIAKRNPEMLLSKTPMILEAIYDNEIATEEQILAWHNTESDKSLLLLRDEAEQIRLKAMPFIKWLQETDDDDSDENDNEDVVDVE